MNDLDFVTDGTRKKTVLEETIQEIEQTLPGIFTQFVADCSFVS